MQNHDHRLTPIILVLLISVSSSNTIAAPQQLTCILTDTDTHPGSENRSLTITFDEDDKTLTAKEGDLSYGFSDRSISSVTINGLNDLVSLGIDRSSLGIVWQQYKANEVVSTEFGQCHLSGARSAE